MKTARYSNVPACGGTNVPVYAPPLAVVIVGVVMYDHSPSSKARYCIITMPPDGTAGSVGLTFVTLPLTETG